MDKRALSERDICPKFITPALREPGGTRCCNRPFRGTMAKLSTRSKTIERGHGASINLTTAMDFRRRIDTAYEIYLGLYQAITGPEERQKIYRGLSREFFDPTVIDERPRGSAAEDSAWREILDYFSGATQIGMTATPKGEPVCSDSPKQGIRDGFLAPRRGRRSRIANWRRPNDDRSERSD